MVEAELGELCACGGGGHETSGNTELEGLENEGGGGGSVDAGFDSTIDK